MMENKVEDKIENDMALATPTTEIRTSLLYNHLIVIGSLL